MLALATSRFNESNIHSPLIQAWFLVPRSHLSELGLGIGSIILRFECLLILLRIITMHNPDFVDAKTLV